MTFDLHDAQLYLSLDEQALSLAARFAGLRTAQVEQLLQLHRRLWPEGSTGEAGPGRAVRIPVRARVVGRVGPGSGERAATACPCCGGPSHDHELCGACALADDPDDGEAGVCSRPRCRSNSGLVCDDYCRSCRKLMRRRGYEP